MRATLWLLSGLVLAACNSAPPLPAPAATAAPSGVTPADFKLPEGAGCAGDIARLQAIIDNDQKTGHIGASVHDRMQADLAKARIACDAGRDGEARAMVAATRKRNGYPAS